MDAGLAALLGAVVGAIGTGGAGVTAALLARSQARMQVLAEHARLIREPRKNAYIAYITACLAEHDRLSEARRDLVVGSEISSGAEERFEEAEQLFRESTEAQAELEHLEAQVYVEGPKTVIDAAVELGGKLTDFRHAVLDALHAERPVPSDLIEAAAEKRSEAYGAYIDFLYAASDVMGADGVRTLPD